MSLYYDSLRSLQQRDRLLFPRIYLTLPNTFLHKNFVATYDFLREASRRYGVVLPLYEICFFFILMVQNQSLFQFYLTQRFLLDVQQALYIVKTIMFLSSNFGVQYQQYLNLEKSE